jgi:endonuclease/exonuclease/phosphatase family metal-dependent hydrolase
MPGKLTTFLVAPVLTMALLTTANAGSLQNIPEPSVIEIAPFTGSTLKVLTLNLAHGRKDSFNQLFLSKSRISKNLTDVATVLNRTDANIVALQEADGPSRWSGGFDHVNRLVELTGYPASAHTNHATSFLFSYGTALVSKIPFRDAVQHTFQPSPPTTNKGFTLGQIRWQPGAHSTQTLDIDIVSVHLDFSRKKVREKQIAEMSQILAGRSNPMIIMGDFNSNWFASESIVQVLAEQFGLYVYQPESKSLGTYNSSGRRLDWILISRELGFADYRVLPDIISDHLAVLATIVLKKEPIQ